MKAFRRLHADIKHTIRFYTELLQYFLSSKSLDLAGSVQLHAFLLKLGVDRRTKVGNYLVHLYFRLGAVSAASRVFHCLPNKNTFTWNIMIGGLFGAGRVTSARHLFDEMPHKDVVSWNSMVSGYVSVGLTDEALRVLFQMRESGTRSSAFTFSIAASCVPSALQVKEVHGAVVRNGLGSTNVVVGNSLIDRYGKLGLWEYAAVVFDAMEERDMVSWNSVISACGYKQRAVQYFGVMMGSALLPDHFTMSSVLSACADLVEVNMGEEALALCFKLGCVSNSIVSSAAIDMYSKCGRLDDSIKLYQQFPWYDSAICNSMISAYARNGCMDEAQILFLSSLYEDLEPTEFTFSSILRSNSGSSAVEYGPQVHTMVLKLGFDSEMIVASSLMDVYVKLGSVESATKIFTSMAFKDLASWNTMIVGLAVNGHGTDALKLFSELQKKGIKPDRITLAGILSACSLEGLTDEGLHIFLSMARRYQIKPSIEHYAHLLNMILQEGRLEEATEILLTMVEKPNGSVWGMLLEACQAHDNLNLAEFAGEKIIELEPHSSLPYAVLSQMYGRRGKWESVARMKRAMQENHAIKKVKACSWISIRNHTYAFEADRLLQCGGETMYSMLRFLEWDMVHCGYVPTLHEVGSGGELCIRRDKI